MSNYKFIKPYTTSVVVGGVVGIMKRTFEVGTVWEGVSEDGNTVTIRIAKYSELNKVLSNTSRQDVLKVPIEYLEKTNDQIQQIGTKPNVVTKPNIETPNTPVSSPTTNKIFSTKNIIIGTIVIVAIVGILKWKKIF